MISQFGSIAVIVLILIFVCILAYRYNIVGGVIFGQDKDGTYINNKSEEIQIIENIVNELFNFDAVKTQIMSNKHAEYECIAADDDYTVKWSGNLKKACIVKPIMAIGSVDYEYLLSYQIRDLMTSTYVQNIKGSTKPIEIAAYFNGCLSYFVNNYNKQNQTNHKDEDLKVLYKGGNVINMYIKKFMTIIKSYKNDKQTNDITNSIGSIIKRGDWDYALYANTDDDRFNNSAKTLILYLLQRLKKTFDTSDLLADPSDNLQKLNYKPLNMGNYRELAKSIQTKFFTPTGDGSHILKNYATATGKHIVLNNIKTNEYIISKDDIKVNDDSINIKSKISIPRDNKISDYWEVNSLMNSENNITPKDFETLLLASNISVNYIANISSRITYLITDFDLARVKINNKFNITIEGKTLNRNVSADIIDMSFINKNDTKSKFLHNKLHTIHMREWNLVNVNGYVIPYLSTSYLFYDLVSMLVEEGVYPWEDKKYLKRLDRMINIGILSCFIDIKSIVDLRQSLYILISLYENCQDLETLYIYLTTFVKCIPNSAELEIKLFNNHITYILIKLLYKLVITYRYINHKSLTADQTDFIQNSLKYVIDNTSSKTTFEKFKRDPFDMVNYRTLTVHIYDRLKFYLSFLETLKPTDIITISQQFNDLDSNI